MSEITFLFGTHNHQPIGNFGSVFEEAYQKSYAPFAKILLAHPTVRWNLHCTGILWEWIEKNHPEYFGVIETMVRRKQLELLSGGFYEPILPIIPNWDKRGQIQKLTQYLKKHFSTTPKGMWCAERVWEPHLPFAIAQAGIEYTVLDDTHFLSGGLKENQLYGYYKVEEENQLVDIFPISKDLRYAIPFQEPEEVIDIFSKAVQKDSSAPCCLTMMDDGEKFGHWPNTYQSVYKEKWLEKFIQLLEKNSSWIKTNTFGNYRSQTKPLGKTYLPCASYSEMLEWSNGFWRNFLAKYPESNWMHKKMLRLSFKVQDLKERSEKSSFSKQIRERIEKVQNFVWASQCNCAYWHGIFGGLYLPMLRQAIYQNLIQGETLLDEINLELEIGKKGSSETNSITTELLDFDGDGKQELLIGTPSQNLIFSLEEGGTLAEWDFKAQPTHISNLMTRRPESYHEKLKSIKNDIKNPDGSVQTVQSIHENIKSKQEGLENLLAYDWYKRGNLIDHFLHPDTKLDSFQKCNYGEQGDFVSNPYSYELGEYSVIFRRKGMVWIKENRREITVLKEIEYLRPSKKSKKPQILPGPASLKATYKISNESREPIPSLWFAPEFCFSFSVLDPKTDICLKGVRFWERLDIHNRWKLRIDFTTPTDLWIFPLETISNSEGGFEKTFQGLILLPHWKFELTQKDPFVREISFQVEKI